MPKYESALEKAKRYESELKAGFYFKGNKMVPVDEERQAFCASFINEVNNNLYSRDKHADPLDTKIQDGKAAALNQLRKEYNYKKRKEEEKIASKVNSRKKSKSRNQRKGNRKRRKSSTSTSRTNSGNWQQL